MKIFFRIFLFVLFSSCLSCFGEKGSDLIDPTPFLSIKQPEFAGSFYPAQKAELSTMIDNFLEKAEPESIPGEIFALISPHAGYGYSGQAAGFGYKLIKNKPYKTVIILGTSHHKLFNGAAVYPQGVFVTSLGALEIDDEFIKNIIGKGTEIFADESAFSGEHSVEVQLPFLQKALSAEGGSAYGGKIVPIVVGDCSLDTCKKIALLLKEAIGGRKDVLVIVSTDMYHGYDFDEAKKVDALTLDFMKKMDYEGLYYSLREEKSQLCGGFATVIALELAGEMGCKRSEVLNHTNSAEVFSEGDSHFSKLKWLSPSAKGQWTVGYVSCAIVKPVAGQGENMLNNQQRNRLLKIARDAIEYYLKNGKKLEVNEVDPLLNQKMGAFVTLNKHGELRGCIGNLTASQPLYLTIRDMAIEAATDDPRFSSLTLSELKDVEIEISALSALERVDSAVKIELGKHGVMVRKGNQSGVFLPQVATETGWSKEEFLRNLCAHKAGLEPDAWKDKSTELYIFSAEVFSEKNTGDGSIFQRKIEPSP